MGLSSCIASLETPFDRMDAIRLIQSKIESATSLDEARPMFVDLCTVILAEIEANSPLPDYQGMMS